MRNQAAAAAPDASVLEARRLFVAAAQADQQRPLGLHLRVSHEQPVRPGGVPAGRQAFGEIVVVELAFAQSSAAKTGGLAAARQRHFQIDVVVLVGAGRNQARHQHHGAMGRSQHVLNVANPLLLQVLHDPGLILRRTSAAGALQSDDQSDAADRHRRGVADRRFVADGIDVVMFALIVGLQARLQGGASKQPDEREQPGPQHPLHGPAAAASPLFDPGTTLHGFAPDGWHPVRAGCHPGPPPRSEKEAVRGGEP